MENYFDLSHSNDPQFVDEISVGEIKLPTGSIVAGDPFLTFDVKPFTTTVEPGTYPVHLCIAEIDDDHYRVAFAKLKLKDELATKWYLAVTDDTRDKVLNKDEYFGFPVDAGLACFIDEQTNDAYVEKIDRFYEEKPNGNYYDDVLAAEFDAYSKGHPYSRELGDWNNHIIDPATGENTIMFATGWGDGYYPVYWGINDQHEIVELVADFLIEFDTEGSTEQG